jgi:OmpA-OmpF porin, OOP family
MKCNPLRWLWGLLPIAALTFLAGQFEHGRIESDLTERVGDRFKATGLTWAQSAFSGRDGIVTGRATDESDPQKALDVASSVWGVRVTENRAELIEKAASYAWWAQRSDRRVLLRGLVPNDNTRQSIVGLARAQFPDSDVVDEMRLARGVPSPDTWLAGVSFGLKQLNGLKTGEARLDGLGLSVSGEAASQTGYRGVKTALANDMPRGIRLLDEKVVPPVISPYLWGAGYTGSELTLTGYVPNDRMRADVLAAAKTAFPRVSRVTDRMEVGDGAPSGFLSVISTSLKELARLEDGKANLRDTALSVDGLAVDEATAQTTRRSLRSGLPQNYRLADQIRFRDVPVVAAAPVLISPYTGGVDIDSGRVVITGYAPSQAVRDTLLQSARTRFPGKPIDDRLVIAPGAPDHWQRCMDAGMLGLARTGNGRTALVDRRLDVTARSDDEDIAAAVPGDIRSAVQGVCEVNARIDYAAPPEPDLTWRASFDGATVALRGAVVSAATKAALVAQARRQFPGTVRVIDDMTVTENRSRSWPRAAEAGLAALTELDRGEAVLTRQQLVVTGESRFEPAIVERVRERVGRDLPRGYAGREQITMLRPQAPAPAQQTPQAAPSEPTPRAADVQACQARLREVAGTGTITFERARDNLTADSTQTLNRLAQIARTCPRAKIEIEGHTDAEGTPERNQRLSDRRANAVLVFLTRAGVDGTTMTSVGYGETKPIAPNDTPTNRARNRRIEFTVTE